MFSTIYITTRRQAQTKGLKALASVIVRLTYIPHLKEFFFFFFNDSIITIIGRWKFEQ